MELIRIKNWFGELYEIPKTMLEIFKHYDKLEEIYDNLELDRYDISWDQFLTDSNYEGPRYFNDYKIN